MTTNATSTFDDLVDLITVKHYDIILKTYAVFYIMLGLTGIVNNTINMYVFVKIGLVDIVTITFFSMSLSDLGVTIFSTVSGVCMSLVLMPGPGSTLFFIVDPWAGFLLAVNIMSPFVQGSYLLTAFMAIQRCCCVALPFGFRSVFTKKFVLVIVSVIFLFTAFFLAMAVSMYYLEWRQMGGKNISNYQLAYRAHRSILLSFMLAFQAFGVSIVSQLVVVFCLIVMTIGLRRAASFRLKIVSKPGNVEAIEARTTIGQSEDKLPEKTSSKSSQQLSEQRLLKTVIFISTVFVICNTPAVVHVFLRMSIPGFDTFGALKYSSRLSSATIDVCSIINSSINFFIYFKSNPKFNSTLRSAWPSRRLCKWFQNTDKRE